MENRTTNLQKAERSHSLLSDVDPWQIQDMNPYASSNPGPDTQKQDINASHCELHPVTCHHNIFTRNSDQQINNKISDQHTKDAINFLSEMFLLHATMQSEWVVSAQRTCITHFVFEMALSLAQMKTYIRRHVNLLSVLLQSSGFLIQIYETIQNNVQEDN